MLAVNVDYFMDIWIGGICLLLAIVPLITGKPLQTGGAFQKRGPYHTPGPAQQIILRFIFLSVFALCAWDLLQRIRGRRFFR